VYEIQIFANGIKSNGKKTEDMQTQFCLSAKRKKGFSPYDIITLMD
jgi:hypothetical protein